MAPGALAQVLGDLPNVHNDNLLVGFDTSDDASVFRVGENQMCIRDRSNRKAQKIWAKYGFELSA